MTQETSMLEAERPRPRCCPTGPWRFSQRIPYRTPLDLGATRGMSRELERVAARSSYEKSCQARPQVKIQARTAFHSCIWNELVTVTASVILEAVHIITYPWPERSQYGTGIRIRLHVLHIGIMMVSLAASISYHDHCHCVYFDSWLLLFICVCVCGSM